jgi:hypothetical protein
MNQPSRPVSVSKAIARTGRDAFDALTETGLGALVLVLGILLLIAYSGAGLTT